MKKRYLLILLIIILCQSAVALDDSFIDDCRYLQLEEKVDCYRDYFPADYTAEDCLVDFTREIGDYYDAPACAVAVAALTDDPSACELFVDEPAYAYRSGCYYTLAMLTDDIALCENIDPGQGRWHDYTEDCYMSPGYRLISPSKELHLKFFSAFVLALAVFALLVFLFVNSIAGKVVYKYALWASPVLIAVLLFMERSVFKEVYSYELNMTFLWAISFALVVVLNIVFAYIRHWEVDGRWKRCFLNAVLAVALVNIFVFFVSGKVLGGTLSALWFLGLVLMPFVFGASFLAAIILSVLGRKKGFSWGYYLGLWLISGLFFVMMVLWAVGASIASLGGS